MVSLNLCKLYVVLKCNFWLCYLSHCPLATFLFYSIANTLKAFYIQLLTHLRLLQIMVPYNFTEFIDDLTYQVKNNIIPMSRIDDAVKRILRVKFVMGLFENPLADLSLADQLGNKVCLFQIFHYNITLIIFIVLIQILFNQMLQEHRELAREAVRKSLVLLKNGKSATKPLLPLSKKAGKILIAGSHADNLGFQCGGWTITWQGLGGNDLTVGMLKANHEAFIVF